MNKIYSSILILASAFCIMSCNTKETPVNRLDDLTEEIETNSKDYSDEDWQQVAQEYEQIDSDLEKHHSEYTDSELQEIGRKKGKCLALFTKHAAKNFKEEIEDAMHEATGVVQGFTEGLKEE